MITAIVTFVLLLTLGYIIFVHSGKQEGVNKTIGYVVIGVITVAVIAVPVYSLARGFGGRKDFAWRGSEGRPGMQGGIFAPGFPQQGRGGMNGFRNFGNCPQGGMRGCPQGMDDRVPGQGRRNGAQFSGIPFNGGQRMPNGDHQFFAQSTTPAHQNQGAQPSMALPGNVNSEPATPTTPATLQGDNANSEANPGTNSIETTPALPNSNN